jgi:hypothetical protein
MEFFNILLMLDEQSCNMQMTTKKLFQRASPMNRRSANLGTRK